MITWDEERERRAAYGLKKHLESPMIMCACGCGELMHEKNKQGRKRKYLSGHNGRKYPIGTDSNMEAKRKRSMSSKDILCKCGCGKTLKSISIYGVPVKYIHGHKPDSKYRTKEEKAIQGKARYRKNKVKAIKHLGGKCTSCNLAYDGTNAAIYHFHHLDPATKESILARKFGGGFEKAIVELDKCILLCANCHALEHSEGF